MAPNLKRSRDTGKSRDKAKRKRRPSDTEQLYKTIGKLCGEECDQEILQVTDSMEDCRASSKRVNDDVEMNDNHSDDEDFEPKQRVPSSTVKSGRVAKSRAKKSAEAEMSLQMGMQKAKRFICEALDFGVQAGFLTPKDNKGKLLQVSTDLLNLDRKPRGRRQKRDPTDTQQQQQLNDDSDEGERGRSKRGCGKRRVLRKKKSCAGKKSRSRSRSRSKKGGCGPCGKRRNIPGNGSTFPASNRSDDPDGERTTTGAEGEAERDEMEVQNKEINNSEDDRKSTKSQKSSKSNLNKHEEEKSKGNENDEENSNDEASEEEEEEDKK